jgi:hypothetical protein
MDVIPLDGVARHKAATDSGPRPRTAPAIVGENPPDDMKGFKEYIRNLLR